MTPGVVRYTLSPLACWREAPLLTSALRHCELADSSWHELTNLTDQSFTCTPASHTTKRRGAAVAAPNNALAEAICNCRDAVAPNMAQELQLRSI